MASFFNTTITGGFGFTLPVIYVELLEAFNKSKTETTLAQSTYIGVYLGAGKIR